MSSKNTKKKRNLEEELLTYKGALPLECITLNSFRAFNNCKVKYSHEQQKFYETQPFTLKRKNLLRAADREPIQAVEKTKKKLKSNSETLLSSSDSESDESVFEELYKFNKEILNSFVTYKSKGRAAKFRPSCKATRPGAVSYGTLTSADPELLELNSDTDNASDANNEDLERKKILDKHSRQLRELTSESNVHIQPSRQYSSTYRRKAPLLSFEQHINDAEGDEEPEALECSIFYAGDTFSCSLSAFDAFAKIYDNLSKFPALQHKQFVLKNKYGARIDRWMTPFSLKLRNCGNVPLKLELEIATLDTSSSDIPLALSKECEIGDVVKLIFRTAEEKYKVKQEKKQSFEKCYRYFSGLLNVGVGRLSFYFDGALLPAQSTPLEAQLEDDDLIDIIMQ
ncbi:uncharacterized protein LOC135143499 isoform X2 [Zophobas morio]|uniref:uncharacterized protein LOC135143499 isoform X2 n=1 Tax=Zophobas morio TaxID=2755281 RepID=UPI003083DD27